MSAKNGTATKRILATKTAHLPVPLTQAELEKVAEQMGRVEGDLREFYARKKEVTADLKAKEESLDAELGKLGRLQRDKQEYRPVAVRVEADFKEGKVYEIREDTGEVIGERPVNEQDRQATMFGAEPKNGSAPAPAEPKKGEPPELKWYREGETLNADAGPNSIYTIEPMASGRFAVFFRNAGDRDKRVGEVPSETAAKDLARKHQLERAADAMLSNAGAGALTKADTKGDAVARKGRR